MAEILRVTINWTGFVGAPGYTNLYFRDFTAGAVDQAMADGAVAKTDVWVNAWLSSLPTTVTIGVDPTVEVIEETNGELQGFFTTVPEAPSIATAIGAYSAASGACVNWYTNGVRNGRRIRGRSFMVPLGGAGLQSDGTIDQTKLTALRTATNTFISATGSGDLGVWSRPTPGEPDGGVWYVVTSATIPDKVAVLRSRRD